MSDPEFPVLFERPDDAWALFVFAHGAGAGMRHAFMRIVAEVLVKRGVAVLRYQFPFMDAGSRRPDPPAVLERRVHDAVRRGRELAPDLPLFAGGKSMGARMTSRAAAHEGGLDARGLVFFGWPLHYPKKPDTKRAEHLPQVQHPMLFLQGTRDDLADLELIRQVVATLPTATLHVVEGANHAFTVLRRSGRTDEEVLEELAEMTSFWMMQHY
jgi:predicted alpha/beta-hydrolase family hydrolase